MGYRKNRKNVYGRFSTCIITLYVGFGYNENSQMLYNKLRISLSILYQSAETGYLCTIALSAGTSA